jgi:hypothetical protein
VINVVTIYQALQMYRSAASVPLDGPSFNALAWSIADAVAAWIHNPLNVTLTGMATGTVGAGTLPTGTTRLNCIPVVPSMQASLVMAGVQGPLASPLATVVTLALAYVITQSGGYSGVCPTVGVGTDASKVTMVQAITLVEGLERSMASFNVTGVASPMLARGLGIGIASLVLTTTGIGKVIGVSGPSPSTGPSFSMVE